MQHAYAVLQLATAIFAAGGLPSLGEAHSLLRGRNKRPRPLRSPVVGPVLAQYGDERLKLHGDGNTDLKTMQGKCDKLKDMSKDKVKSEETNCDAVVYDGVKSWGCQCTFIGEGVSCPFVQPQTAADGDQPYKNVPTKDVADLGFNRFHNMGGASAGQTGSFNSVACMYFDWGTYPFDSDEKQMKIYQDNRYGQLLARLQETDDITNAVPAGVVAFDWSMTMPPPGKFDRYGTFDCGGWCTTNNPAIWGRYTTTAAPAE